jgi:hypothetical protein
MERTLVRLPERPLHGIVHALELGRLAAVVVDDEEAHVDHVELRVAGIT